MTESYPTPGAEEHPEVAEISALSEGLLSPERSAEVSDHLVSCVLCEEVQTSLEEISSALGTLPGPVRMPEDIAGRIDAALAAEALLDSSGHRTEDTSAPLSQALTGTSEEEEYRQHTGSTRAVSRETGNTPASDRRTGSSRRPPTRAGGSTGPGRARRRRRVLMGTAAACAALVVGGLAVPMLLGDEDRKETAQSDESQRGINAAELDATVRELLHDAPAEAGPSIDTSRQPGGDRPSLQEDRDGQGVSPKASPTDGPTDGPTAPFGAESAVHVPKCVTDAIDRPEPPLTASRTTYEGAASYVIVLPHPGDEQQVDAYVVDAACADSSSDNPGTILAEETVDRT